MLCFGENVGSPNTNKKRPLCITHLVTCSSTLCPLSPPASTSTFHLTVTCNRPAMWDSRYCPSLLAPLTPLHPLPRLSSLYLLPPPRPPFPTPPSLYPRTLTENDQPSLVWFDRGKFYLTFEGKFSLQQGSAHTRYYEAHSCKLWPSSLLPLSSFPSWLLHHHHPFITLTLAMLSPCLSPLT